MQRPIVYLDTQDFSRFGDVLRGKADGAAEKIFLALEERVASGDVIFAVSMPILGELLQYDPSFRDTTLCKAQAVERLCGIWALVYPSRLIASEIAFAAHQAGLAPAVKPFSVISSERYWYPNISETFRGLEAQIQDEVSSKIDGFGLVNRKNRRGAKKIAKKLNVAQAAAEAAPEMASTYGIPQEVFIRSIVALLRRSITPEEASRQLFSAIAAPVTFVETYFERVENERTLPEWIGGFGKKLEQHLTVLRDKVHPIMNVSGVREHISAFLAEWPIKLGNDVLNMVDEDDLSEFYLTAENRDQFIKDAKFVASVPAATIIGSIVPEYASQVIGLAGGPASIEMSFGGDLVHALYLPHVDLWRGDRRFSKVVRDAVPALANRVVPTLKELPATIDGLNRARIGSAPGTPPS